MKEEHPKLPRVVTHQGRRYIAETVLVASAQDKQVLMNAALMLKVGANHQATLAEVLTHVFAGFVLQVSGTVAGVTFTPAEAAALQSALDQKFKGSA